MRSKGKFLTLFLIGQENVFRAFHAKECFSVDPLYIFLSGSGGCGKSHLIKTIYHSLSKTFMYHVNEPHKPHILLLIPTGFAAINIEGTTIPHGLGISPGKNIQSLQDKQRSDLRNRLSEVKLIIIDEISIISRQLF